MYVAFQILCSGAAICGERFLCQIPQCVGRLDKRQAQVIFIYEAGIKKKNIIYIADNETAFHSGAKKLQELFTETTLQVFQCVR